MSFSNAAAGAAWDPRPARQAARFPLPASARHRSELSLEVFKLTPAQRIAALVRRPSRRFKSMVSKTSGSK